MKIVFMNMDSYGSVDLPEAAARIKGPDGEPVRLVNRPFENTPKRTDPVFEEAFFSDLREQAPDAVFSFNYYPLISRVCEKAGVPYISFVYDCPFIALYSCTVINKCNHIYVFDSGVAEEFNRQGIMTVHYLPLAAGVGRLDAMVPGREHHRRFDADIAFIGGLYTEAHTFFDRMEPALDDYTRGYLEGLMRAQMQVDGMNFVEKCLTPPIVDGMTRAYPIPPNEDGVESEAWIYAQYVINRRITQTERPALLRMIGERFGSTYRVGLYTRDSGFSAPGIDNRGRIDYYDEMPYAVKCAKINLNFTLRSIERGIPLRAFDIMGAGGFLLTNYQEDFFALFEPDVDFVWYESNEDLLDKIDWYLRHDTERERIARSGHDRVMSEHVWEKRLETMLADLRCP
ncbi:MAG: DUF3880 domain-containing protein [Lachnospiraceae bacterium]|nr:DUF3880 domain-containing protein [Lachnospiraceae bacterium]